MTHYIPLKKDFSNFQEVIQIFNNPNERIRLSNNAYTDLIESNQYSYQKFIKDFDNELEKLGIIPAFNQDRTKHIARLLKKEEQLRITKIKLNHLLNKLRNLF